jgi:hypothetical protein
MKTLIPASSGLLFSFLLFGCAAQGPPINTASGRPEVFIPNVAPQRVRAALIDRGIAGGWTLDKDTENTVSFVKKSDNALASVLLASNYDTNVMDRVRFTIIGINGGTKMYASEEFVTNHGSAFEKITPLNNNKNSRGLQNILESFKTRFAPKQDRQSSEAPKPSASPATESDQPPNG